MQVKCKSNMNLNRLWIFPDIINKLEFNLNRSTSSKILYYIKGFQFSLPFNDLRF